MQFFIEVFDLYIKINHNKLNQIIYIMKKKIILMLLILLSITYADGGGNLSAQEPEIESSGTWGGIDWTLTTDGTLTIAPTDNEITKIKPWSETNPKELYQRGEWPAAVNDAISAITGWPYNRSKVKRLIIEEGVTSIGSFVGQEFTNLTGEVVIPSTVTYIGQEAFRNSPMTRLTFAPGGTEKLCIAPGALKKLEIKELVLPSDRPEVHIHSWVFNDCASLEHVIIPANVTFGGQTHIDYMGFNNSGNGDSQVFARCWKLNTMVFLSEEVKNRFYNAPGNKNNINAIGGVTNVVQGIISLSSIEFGVNHVALSWDDVDGATGYNIYQEEVLVSEAQIATTFAKNDLDQNTEYNFTIKAVLENGESIPTIVNAKTKKTVVPAAEATQIGVDHITLSWDDVNYAKGYNIYKGEELVSEAQTATTFTANNLEKNTEYCFKVSTVYDIDESNKTEEIRVTTKSLAAKVNETEYGTIDEAIAYWTDETTLTLLADVILSDAITLISDETRTLEFGTFTMTAASGESAFIIPENSTVILNNGKLTQNSGFVISTSGTLTLQDMTITGTVEYLDGEMFTNKSFNVSAKKSFTGVGTNPTQNWSTISTPIADAAIPTGTHDLYRFNEPEQEWEYYADEDNVFATLDLGRGYLYANEEDIILELEGAINIDDVVFPLSYTEDNTLAGFNMVGNPFTYNITDNNFSTEATLAEGFYTLGTNGEWIPNTNGTAITPMQSVLIKANKEADLTITNGPVRRTRDGNKHFAIKVSDNNYQDIAYVVFNDGLGLNKIEHRNANVPMIYIPIEDNDYAVATMEEGIEEIPVSFKAGKLGEYTIAADARECELEKLTLVDHFTGVETNLLIEDYSFVARTDDNPDRFHIKINSMNNVDNDDNFVYINNGNIIINNIEGQGTLRIYDVMGRNMAEYNVYETANISSEYLGSGMYIIQMTDNSGVKVQKIIID